MIYFEMSAGVFSEWTGQPIGGVRYPPSIAWKRSSEELADLRLYLPQDAESPPAGYRVVAGSPPAVARINGVVRYIRELEPVPPPTVDAIKDEASRRIVQIAPDWKQRNLTAQAVILAKQVADGTPLSPEQQAAWDAGEALWARIAAIRVRSNEIEAMEPIPLDAFDDSYWP